MMLNQIHKMMKTISIKGKPYVMVNERILYFRDKEAFKDWQITTEIISIDADNVIMKASIYNPDGVLMATGHAWEATESSFINKTSYLENCETSAVGRALGLMGIGIETSIASAEEVGNAIKQQGDERPWMNQKTFVAACDKMNEMPDDDDRKDAYNILSETYKMKNEYRKQLEEIVESQDIKL